MAAPMSDMHLDNFALNKDAVWSVSGKNSVHLRLYKDVENCKALKQMAVAGKLNGVLINPAMIVHPFQVLLATKKAVHNHTINKMTTKNIQTEILYCLSATKNISDSLVKFGITDQQRSVLLAVISSNGSAAEEGEKIGDIIQGTRVDLSSIEVYTDTALMKKVYKVKEPELEIGSLLSAVTGRIASKDFISF